MSKPKQDRILRSLGIYTYLTYKQMVTLGIVTRQNHLSKPVKELAEANYIKCEYKYDETIDHKRNICFLTRKGAKWVERDSGGKLVPNYPKSGKLSKSKGNTKENTEHRLGIINCHIALRNFKLASCIPDILTDGTALPFRTTKLKPDLIFKIKTHRQEEAFLLEFERGVDAEKSFKKVKQHVELMFSRSTYEHLNFNEFVEINGKRKRRSYTSLWVFEKEETMKACLKKAAAHQITINDKPKSLLVLAPFFLFKTITTVEDIMNWTDMAGSPSQLFT